MRRLAMFAVLAAVAFGFCVQKASANDHGRSNWYSTGVHWDPCHCGCWDGQFVLGPISFNSCKECYPFLGCCWTGITPYSPRVYNTAPMPKAPVEDGAKPGAGAEKKN